MKLSEAILAGAKLTEPLMRKFQDFYYEDDGSKVVAACALGAACYALAPQEPVDSFAEVRRIIGEELAGTYVEIDLGRFPELFPPSTCAYRYSCGKLETVVVRLNDNYALSREDIAAVLQAHGF
jgi:hypothetical protein